MLHRGEGGTSRLVRRAEGLYVLTLHGAEGGQAREAANSLAMLAATRGGIERLAEVFAGMAPKT